MHGATSAALAVHVVPIATASLALSLHLTSNCPNTHAHFCPCTACTRNVYSQPAIQLALEPISSLLVVTTDQLALKHVALQVASKHCTCKQGPLLVLAYGVQLQTMAGLTKPCTTNDSEGKSGQTLVKQFHIPPRASTIVHQSCHLHTHGLLQQPPCSGQCCYAWPTLSAPSMLSAAPGLHLPGVDSSSNQGE